MTLTATDAASTPLTPEELDDLIPSYITLRHELNAAEQANILQAEQWALARKRDVLQEAFLSTLHQKMFGQVWKWAGRYRRSARNLGIEAWEIASEMSRFLDNIRYAQAQQIYPLKELAVRFHHKLVWIHPFPNGNGRHARLATDLLLRSMGEERFTWGRESLTQRNDIRRDYIKALQAADNHDYSLLLDFVVS